MERVRATSVILLLLISFFIRVARIDYPSTYIFDEVYHAWTASAYAANDPRGYEWWHTSPKEGTAYEWLHPPVAKLLQAFGIKLFGDNAVGWRIASVIFGTALVGLTFGCARALLGRFDTAFLAAFFVAFDPLAFVQSRIAMNDIFVTTFLVASAWAWWKWKEHPASLWRLFVVSILIGLAVATKWSAVFGLGVLGVLGLFLFSRRRISPFQLISYVVWLFLLPLAIYVASYAQFWLQGHSIQQFIELHRQIWWYQTNLQATHPYQSPAWMWPFAMRSVWYFVEHGKNTIANIYAMGNPLTWGLGLVGVVWAIWALLRRKEGWNVGFLIILYAVLWMPWLLSPRILFLYHYLPAIPFLMILLAHFFTRTTSRIVWSSVAALHVFLFFILSPRLSGFPLPTTFDLWYTFF